MDGDFGGGGEEFFQLVINLAQRDGHSGHLQGGAVLTHIAAPNFYSFLFQFLMSIAVYQVQLQNGRATQAIHHQGHLVAAVKDRIRRAGLLALLTEDGLGVGQDGLDLDGKLNYGAGADGNNQNRNASENSTGKHCYRKPTARRMGVNKPVSATVIT